MNAVNGGIRFQVVHYFAIRHKIHYYLGRVRCGAEAPDDISVPQSHPNSGLLIKCLAIVNRANELGEKEGEMRTFFILLRLSSPSLTATFTTLIHTRLGSRSPSASLPSHTFA